MTHDCSAGSHQVFVGQVLNGYPCCGERSSYVLCRINPKDLIGAFGHFGTHGLFRPDVRSVERMERGNDTVDLDLSITLKYGDLLIAVMRVEWGAGAVRVDADARRDRGAGSVCAVISGMVVTPPPRSMRSTSFVLITVINSARLESRRAGGGKFARSVDGAAASSSRSSETATL